jgi:cyanate permease
MINNNRGSKEAEEDHNWFTPKKVLVYCIIVGLISVIISIFIDSLGLLSVAAFLFTSIAICTCLARNFINGKIEEEKDILFDDISVSFNLHKKNYSVSTDRIVKYIYYTIL